MLRDLRIFRRNPMKISSEEANDENLPTDPPESSAAQMDLDPGRPPLNTISEPALNPRLGPEQETISRRKLERTPSKNRARGLDAPLPFRTPEKLGAARSRFGWVPRNGGENGDEVSHGGSVVAAPPISRGLSLGNSGWHGVSTPRTYRTGGRASSVQSDTSSTQSTPTKSVTKPACSGFSSSRPPLGAGLRVMNFSTASKGVHTASALPTVVNTVEVPHFELREDPSFWLDHNVQVVIRVRPLSSSEKNLHGYNRCLKQESSQNIVWIAQQEARFTFDHVACETVDQEMLFRVAGLPMVENCISGYNSSMFAYGQTGSGKTYTMLGEIDEHEFRPSPDRGMTPRIFEFLFARIRAEEESRRDEKLKYSCRCSFLEIYNEQVTDLLEPSSTNLLLREDLQKGVYVENLTEFEVETVNDILRLLFQGAANRKVAATNMNRESSRSHSVFTCVIESRWEKDSMTNLRFARLNLVDLAGSERQKTSGAEGERLKEAANINKSLSTLGHVIMILADMAHGKQRHVPYRDSRLTFLLQDSLGGNSKTMIIANVSPSICCANETLSTLKFAQRAKLIQNNAVVNEDASGDITALQHQIRLLKEELSVLKRQNVSRSLSFRSEILEDFENNIRDASASERLTVSKEVNGEKFYDHEPLDSIRVSTKQLKALEATLAGALRREKMAETTIKQLEAEIEQLNRLVRQREEDTRCSKMMLKFREDKICRMESLLEGVLHKDSYFLEENNALTEEIQLLRSRADRNPEVTRFALENIRLLDQLRRYQDFYDEGERELLLTEVSELRNQLTQILEGKSEQELQSDPFKECQLENTCLELENCRNDLKSCLEINAKLTREINDLHTEIANIKSVTYDSHVDVEMRDVESCFGSQSGPVFTKNNEELILKKTWNHTEELLNLQLELDILKEILREEKSARLEGEKSAFEADNELQLANKKLLEISKQNEDMKNELKNSRSLIEALESQNILSINELDELRESNNRLIGTIKGLEEGISLSGKNLSANFEAEEKLFRRDDLKDRYLKYRENEGSPLQEKLKKMQASLEKARMLNNRYQCDQASQNSHERETEEVCRQVEAETAEVIICLQEELLTLQQHVDNSNRNELLAKECLNALQTEMKELHEKLYLLTQENERLSELVEEKERGISSLTDDWENLTHEIAAVLADGNSSLEDASNQVNFMSSSFHQRSWIGEQVGRIVRSISEKDVLINELQKHVEDAQHVRCDMEWKLRSLRGATLAITEAQQQENSNREREIIGLTSQLSEKVSVISELQDRIKLCQDHMRQSEICATVAFVIVNRLSEVNAGYLQELKHAKLLLNQSGERILQKDAPHHVQRIMQKEAQDQYLLLDLPQGCDLKPLLEDCDTKPLLNIHEQNQTSVLDGYIEEQEENAAKPNTADELSVARGRLNEFKTGVQNLHYCMHGFAGEVKGPAEVCSSGDCSVEIADNGFEDRVEIKSTRDVIEIDKHDVQNVPGCRIKSSLSEDFIEDNCGMLRGETFSREATIVLLEKELDFALGNLKDAQARMDKLHKEKEKIKKSEMQNREKMEQFRAEVQKLRSEIISKEEYFVFRMQELEHKIQKIEENAVASNACLRKEKEVLQFELIDAKASASQKANEASNLLTKIEEAQKTMQEADIMVNALIEAKEAANLEIQRHNKIEMALYSERSSLISKIEDLQSNLNTKEQEYEYMEMNHRRCLTEANTSIQELENMFRHLQAMFTEKFELITSDLHWLKSHLQNYTDSARTLLEQTWTEIIGKDCAVSVLHLCHMGILLERITGLNAENGFLYHGLCESDSLIADLRQHNVRAEKELEICSILKGKLLVDINNSFNRISKKECEALEFKAKLNSFEQRILNLQLQEESMLARSNLMGSELAILMEEFDKSNRNALTAASVHEKLSREKEESYRQQEQLQNEIKSAHEMLNELFCQQFHKFVNISTSKSHIMLDSLKTTGVKEAEGYVKLIKCQAESIMMNMLARDLQLLVMESELEQKITECNTMVSQIVELERERDTFCVFVEKASKEIVLWKIEGELKSSEMHYLLVENEKLKSELVKLKVDHYEITECLQELGRKFASSVSQVGAMEQENRKLHDIICSLEASFNSTKINLEETSAKLAEVQCSHDVVSKELDMKTRFIEIQTQRTSAIKSENDALRKEKEEAYKRWKEDSVAMLQIKSLGIAESVEMAVEQINHISDNHFVLIDKMCHEISECSESASTFAKELESLELSAKSLVSDNLFLQSELMRKDELSIGLLFDLSLLQESASIARDQKDELQEMAATLRALEGEVALKSCELHKAVARGQIIEAELLEKRETISAIQLELAEKDCILDQVSSENIELKVQLENIIGMNHNIEKELVEKIRATEKLEEELLMMASSVGQKNQFLEALQNDITKLTNEKVCLDSEMLSLKEQLEMAHSLAEENEAIATEARQIAEGSKAYAEEKEEEVKLLEKSVEELECTIYALENKVEIVKGETERQRLQKEELARELEAVKYQMLTVHASDSNISRQLEEKESELQQAQENIQYLLKDIADKNSEIAQCKEHISELNMHAEAQAREYKQKFRELEAMAHQVKIEPTFSSAMSLSSCKSEKGSAKPRGSGSPFKCIGLGLTQQINSEKDEELTTARCQIQELEALAASRQKEIFMLNTRLAAAESMTHDVIRDLLGVKLDMTNYASLLDEKHIQKAKQEAPIDGQQYHEKDEEVTKLKRQLNEFIKERQSWIDEINRKHTEMVAAQVLVEKLRQKEQLLIIENDMLKVDNAKNRKMAIELEDEIRKVSSHQNLHMRIHHHAKIKEENNLLKVQNDELIAKLQRSEAVLSRVKEELACYRASNGKNPYIDFDKEEQLERKLNDTEGERIQLAQNMLSLCTSILKAAGLTESASNISISAAEDALCQLKERNSSLESELQDLKLKCKIYSEKFRLFELEQQSSALRLQRDEGCSANSTSSD